MRASGFAHDWERGGRLASAGVVRSKRDSMVYSHCGETRVRTVNGGREGWRSDAPRVTHVSGTRSEISGNLCRTAPRIAVAVRKRAFVIALDTQRVRGKGRISPARCIGVEKIRTRVCVCAYTMFNPKIYYCVSSRERIFTYI